MESNVFFLFRGMKCPVEDAYTSLTLSCVSTFLDTIFEGKP